MLQHFHLTYNLEWSYHNTEKFCLDICAFICAKIVISYTRHSIKFIFSLHSVFPIFDKKKIINASFATISPIDVELGWLYKIFKISSSANVMNLKLLVRSAKHEDWQNQLLSYVTITQVTEKIIINIIEIWRQLSNYNSWELLVTRNGRKSWDL